MLAILDWVLRFWHVVDMASTRVSNVGWQDGSRHSETLKLRNDCPLARFDGTPRGCYDRNAGWSSLVARWAHNPKVGGSNPPPATKFSFWFQWVEPIHSLPQ